MKRILGAALLYPLAFSLGCSTTGGGSAPDPNSGNGGGNNGGTGSTGAGNNGGAGFHTQTTGGNVSTSSSAPDIDSGCGHDTTKANLTRVNILFLLDKSGSMGNDPNGGWNNADTRWNPVVTTLDAFFNDPNSTGLWASLSFLPADGDIKSACKVANYSSGSSAIKVPLTLLNDTGRQTFLDRLCDPAGPQTTKCIVPAGGTPTRSALQGTINYMNAIPPTVPPSKTVIVFLTDGEPGFGYQPPGTTGIVNGLHSCDDLNNTACVTACNGLTNADCGDVSPCTPAATEVDAVASVIQSAPPKSIYVFGVGDLTSSTMDEWATASANPAVALQGLSGAQAAATFKAGLQAIQKSYITCNIDVPKAQASGAAIDFAKVNVDYINGSNVDTQQVKDPGCTITNTSTTQFGWQYDNDAAPTKILLCASACSMAQADPNGRIQTVLGCDTRVQIL